MLKSPNQMRFEQQSQNLEKQLDIFSQRISKIISYDKVNTYFEKFTQFNPKIKNITALYTKIDSEMKFKKNHNQYDLKEKLRKYSIVKDKLTLKYQTIGKQMETIQRNYLINNPKSPNSPSGPKQIEMQNMKKANEIVSRFKNANTELDETHQITTDAMGQLRKQEEDIDGMKDDLREVEAELGMVDQLMRIIKNRNMVTKLLLVMMILLMGLVDVMLFAVKVI